MAEGTGFGAWVKKLLMPTAEAPKQAAAEAPKPNVLGPAPIPISPPIASTKPTIKTYVLIGDNIEMVYAQYSIRGDVTIIRAKPKQSIEDAVKGIETPANILLAAHGGQDGTFGWNKNERLPYARLFAALPREGIASVTLSSCYGGTAISDSFLEVAPAGMLVQSMVGARNLNSGNLAFDFISETKNETNPVTLFLKTLDNFDPKEYKNYIEYWDKKRGGRSDSNPENALPHIIGMGGKPPQRIYLELVAAEINSRIITDTHEDAWKKSIKRVVDTFETQHIYLQNPDGQMLVQDLGPEAEIKLDDDIERIAGMLRRGEKLGGKTPIERAENKRIAYALTAAFLDESGTLDYWKAQQVAQVPKTVKEAVQDKQQIVTATEQSSGIAKEMEAFAKKFGIQGVDENGNLTKSEIQAIQGALGVAKDGAIGKKTLAAYEQALHEGHLPAPATTPARPKSAAAKHNGN